MHLLSVVQQINLYSAVCQSDNDLPKIYRDYKSLFDQYFISGRIAILFSIR